MVSKLCSVTSAARGGSYQLLIVPWYLCLGSRTYARLHALSAAARPKLQAFGPEVVDKNMTRSRNIRHGSGVYSLRSVAPDDSHKAGRFHFVVLSISETQDEACAFLHVLLTHRNTPQAASMFGSLRNTASR